MKNPFDQKFFAAINALFSSNQSFTCYFDIIDNRHILSRQYLSSYDAKFLTKICGKKLYWVFHTTGRLIIYPR